MSRTRTGAKGPGYELWGRRPGTGLDAGRGSKRIVHGIERAQEKELIRDEVEELEEDLLNTTEE